MTADGASTGSGALLQLLAQIVGESHVLASPDDREDYAYDAFSPERARVAIGGTLPLPLAVVRPGSNEEVKAVVRLANDERVLSSPSGAALASWALPSRSEEESSSTSSVWTGSSR